MIVALVLAQCFVLTDETPGWKRVELPRDAPHLAALGELEQFRLGAPLTVTSELGELLVSTAHGLGRVTYTLTTPQSRRVELTFAKSLDGAKVDAREDGPRGRFVLLDERRARGATVTLEPSGLQPATLTVTVHSHLRETPRLQAATAVRRVESSDLVVPPAFSSRGALYLSSPGGRVMVCERADAQLGVLASSLRQLALEPEVRTAGLSPARRGDAR